MPHVTCPNCHFTFNTRIPSTKGQELLSQFGPGILDFASTEVRLLVYLSNRKPDYTASVLDIQRDFYPHKLVALHAKKFHPIKQLIYRTRLKLLRHNVPYMLETVARNPTSWALRKLSHDRSA